MAVESLVDFVEKYAANGNEVAIRHRRGYRMETWSYAQIVQGANRLARELEFCGVGKADAVLLWGENSPEWIVVFFGCLLRGVVIVPVDHGSTVEFVSRVGRGCSYKLRFSLPLAARSRLARCRGLESISELGGLGAAPRHTLHLHSAAAALEIIFLYEPPRNPGRGDLSWRAR
jgi:hypothetical protein